VVEAGGHPAAELRQFHVATYV